MPSRFFSERGVSIKIVEVVFIAAGFSLIAMPAKAGFQTTGFQWVAPTEAPAPAMPNSPGGMPGEAPTSLTPAPEVPVTKAPSMGTPSLAGENPEVISPIVIEGQPLSPSASSAPSVPGQPSSLGSLSAGAAPDTIVEGFANNVPLAVALREVLPPGYGFSIDQDVDLGTLVSFQGGKSWRETLRSMLAPAGLGMREQHEMVAIGKMQSSGAMEGSASNEPVLGGPTPLPQASPPPPAPPAQAYASYRPGGDNGPRPAWSQPGARLPPPPAPPPPVSSSRVSSGSVVDTWSATRGETLHKALEDWSRRAGAEFEWSAEYDYPLQASISYTGTFEEAVRSLLSGFEDAHPQPVAELHQNPAAGQMVLVIQTRGNSYTD